MKKIGVLGLFAVIVIALTAYFGPNKKAVHGEAIYQEIARINQSSLKDVQGQYFLLHFWAKWCAPCTDEIPVLVSFARFVNDHKNADGKPVQFEKPLRILAVSLDPTLEESKEILPDKGANLPPNFILLHDPDHKFAERMGSYQYPETYFIGPKGDILEKWVGVQKWLQPRVFEFFRQKLL
ncbi:MAG: TlpA family protein disulfide reductase [Bdellovibrionales bacterium]|nr:TlpA family protein disulfide reductase [Bdellovibrionales bacterium]